VTLGSPERKTLHLLHIGCATDLLSPCRLHAVYNMTAAKWRLVFWGWGGDHKSVVARTCILVVDIPCCGLRMGCNSEQSTQRRNETRRQTNGNCRHLFPADAWCISCFV